MPAPTTSSRHLYTGRHQANTQAATWLRARHDVPCLHPGNQILSRFRRHHVPIDASAVVHTRSSSRRTPDPLTASLFRNRFPPRLLTGMTLRRFGSPACTANPEGLPPSLAQHGRSDDLLHRHHSLQDARSAGTPDSAISTPTINSPSRAPSAPNSSPYPHGSSTFTADTPSGSLPDGPGPTRSAPRSLNSAPSHYSPERTAPSVPNEPSRPGRSHTQRSRTTRRALDQHTKNAARATRTPTFTSQTPAKLAHRTPTPPPHTKIGVSRRSRTASRSSAPAAVAYIGRSVGDQREDHRFGTRPLRGALGQYGHRMSRTKSRPSRESYARVRLTA